MKTSKLIIAGVLLCLLFSITACSKKDGTIDGTQGTTHQSTEPGAQTVLEPEEVSQALPSANPETDAEKLIGSWKDIVDAERFVNVTKKDAGYEYEDNEGKYPAEFKEGKLAIKLSETDAANAYIDSETGHLLIVHQDNISEYEKK